MSQIDWSKAPLHATHWCPGNAIIDAGWIYQAGQEFHSCYAEKGLEHIPNFPAWRALRLIPRPVTPKWNDEGLPPVGMVCEVRPAIGEKREWFECAIKYVGEKIMIIEDKDGEGSLTISLYEFRPIRTPEQIAAEERDKAVKAMLAEFEHTGSLTSHYEVCEVLHKAGYRKFEIVEGDK